MAASKIVPRIEAAEAFAQTNLVLLLRHSPSGVDIDLSLGWTGFEPLDDLLFGDALPTNPAARRETPARRDDARARPGSRFTRCQER